MRLYSPNILIPNAPPVGLGLTRVDGTTVTVAAGAVPMRDRNSSVNSPRYTMATLPSALTKNLLTDWVAGNNQGARFGGVMTTTATAHYFLIRDRVTGLVDVGADSSPGGANIPPNFDFRLIASLARSGNSIFNFVQTGNYFSVAQVIELNTSNLSTSPDNTVELITCPRDVSVKAQFRLDLILPSAVNIFYSSTRNINPFVAHHNVTNAQRYIQEIHLDSSRQLRLWASAANAAAILYSLGYYHPLDFYW